MWTTLLFIIIGSGQLVFAALDFFGITSKHFRRKETLADVTLSPSRTMTRPKLVLVLIVGGFAFSGYGFYRTFDQSKNKPAATSPVTTQSDQEIAQLRAKVKKFEDRAAQDEAEEWKPLTQQEVSAWATELEKYPARDITVFWGQLVKAERFFRSLQAVGQLTGVKVIFGMGYADGTEIELAMAPGDQFGTALAKLLRRVHPLKITEVPDEKGVAIYLPEKNG